MVLNLLIWRSRIQEIESRISKLGDRTRVEIFVTTHEPEPRNDGPRLEIQSIRVALQPHPGGSDA